jgi:hypothetical protein
MSAIGSFKPVGSFQGVKSFDASSLEAQAPTSGNMNSTMVNNVNGQLSVISEGVEPSSAQSGVNSNQKSLGLPSVNTPASKRSGIVDAETDVNRKGSNEALNMILAAGGGAPVSEKRPEPLHNLTNLQDILASNAARSSNINVQQQNKVATPQSVGFLGVKGVTMNGGVVDANALQQNTLDLASQIQTQIQHLQTVQTNLMNSQLQQSQQNAALQQSTPNHSVGTMNVPGNNMGMSANQTLNAILSPSQQAGNVQNTGNFHAQGNPLNSSNLPVMSPQDAQARFRQQQQQASSGNLHGSAGQTPTLAAHAQRMTGGNAMATPTMGVHPQQQFGTPMMNGSAGSMNGIAPPRFGNGTIPTTTSSHNINMPTPGMHPSQQMGHGTPQMGHGYNRMTPQHGPGMQGQAHMMGQQMGNSNGSNPMNGSQGHGSRKSRQELNQLQMKALYNSIDKATLPQPRGDGVGSNNLTPRTPRTPVMDGGMNGNNTTPQNYVMGTATDPFAQHQALAISGKMTAPHPPMSKPPTSMAPHHRQPQASNPEEGITFLEERKRYFSRQKQQAVFHYTLRHAKQYAKTIGMTIEWCFAHLEEKRKIDLANGIKNPIAELAQRTDLDEFTRKAEKARLEIIKKADEIDFLLRQKALESAMGMGSGSSAPQSGGGIVSASGAIQSATSQQFGMGSRLSPMPVSGVSTAYGGHHGMASGMSLPGSHQMMGAGYSYAETLPSMEQIYTGGPGVATGSSYM